MTDTITVWKLDMIFDTSIGDIKYNISNASVKYHVSLFTYLNLQRRIQDSP